MKHPTCVYQRERDNFELKMVGKRRYIPGCTEPVHVLTAEEADDLLYELQHAVWARQGAGEGGS